MVSSASTRWGQSTVVPFAPAQPARPTAAAAAEPVASGGPSESTAGNVFVRFLEHLGPEAKERPIASLHTALAGAGGAVVAAGLALAIAGTLAGRGRVALAGIVLAAVALAIRFAVKLNVELRAAAVGMGVVGITAIGVAIADRSLDSAGGWLVVAALFVAAWLLPGFQGRPIMLGLGALALVVALASATSKGRGGTISFTGSQSVARGQGATFLVAAALLLGVVWALDRRGYHGVATSLVVAALVSSFVGAFGTVSKLDNTGGTLLIVLVGVAVCVVGSHGVRRATTWYGALIASVGVVAFLVAAMKPTSIGAVGSDLIIAGLLLIALPVIIKLVRANRTSSGSTPAGTAAFAPPR
jgi:hypothetical protein